LVERIEKAHTALVEAMEDYQALQNKTRINFSTVKLPANSSPRRQARQRRRFAQPLFTTDDDFVDAALKLRAQKTLENQS
jgi:hypothetical protein